MYVNKTEICKFNVTDNISWHNFCFRSLSKDFTKDEKIEIYLNAIVYDFSADHTSIKEEDILNICQNLMVRNNMK